MLISKSGQLNHAASGAASPRTKGSRRFFRTWESRAALVLLVAVAFCGAATYAALTETPPFGNNPDTVIWLLNLDLILLLVVVALIARRIVSLWSGRRRKLAGSGLHVRLVYIFSLLAAAPVIIMTITSAFFFHFGVQTWFSDRVKTAIDESQAVAQAYFDEHREVIRADTLAMANDLDREAAFLIANDEALEKVVETQSMLRNFTEAVIFDSQGHVLARSGLTFSLEFEDVPKYALRQADDGEVVVMTGAREDRIRALIKLNNYIDTYLFVGRMADPKVLSHLAATREATQDYANLQARYSSIEVTVMMIFVVVGLILLMSAIWYGLIFARELVQPIGTLITTADRVRAGDLTARVPEQRTIEEFEYLASAFNRMTKQIQEQQSELIAANRQLDHRRRLIESVLTGVSSGVLGLDAKAVVNLANSSALDLLGLKEKDLVGVSIDAAMPEVMEILEQAHKRPRKTTQAEIPFLQADGTRRMFHVRIVIEMVGEEEIGAILTFDDITELQSAQRKAAWADVARRIAHEIKNPLTPIHLSAERLKRKYMKQVTEDQDAFEQYTDTILRNVEDIGRMVSEFSNFARMPEPVMKPGNLVRDIEESLFHYRQTHPGISFNFMYDHAKKFQATYDAQQIRQAVNNLIQNAADSVEMKADKEPGAVSRIDILLAPYGSDEVVIAVTDSGLGLPKDENPARLSEPYVTHKPKGTGLGLAIVKKIMEDHDGSLLIGTPDWLQSVKGWENLGGATVALLMPFLNAQDENSRNEWAA